MYIIQAASELAPVAKVGGLGDVIHGLSKELVKQGHQVEIILPKYDCLLFEKLEQLKVVQRELCTFEGTNRYHNTIWSAEVDGLKVILIEPHHPSYYFNRERIYGCPDDVDRFAYFSRALLEYLKISNRHPDVLHIHDWPTALIAPLYRELFQPIGLRVKKMVLTLHNLEYQGKCDPVLLTRSGLNAEKLMHADLMRDLLTPSLANLLKGGIVLADALTTVSPHYEQQIKTAEGGFGLNEILLKHEKKLTGILNGIEDTFWNPEKDPHLIARYPAFPPFDEASWKKVLEGKRENRRHLRRHLGLNESNAPIVSSVTRLVPQKGPKLIKHALLKTLDEGGQFILLGSLAPLDIEKDFLELKENLAKNKNVAICMHHDESLAHLIFAGADMFLIPSIFEPCGLTQLIALRYGTVPLARKTGGLADTVFDIDTSELPEAERTGFTFDFPDNPGVNWVLDRSLKCWTQDQTKWQRLMQQGMKRDFSWKESVHRYLSIYSAQ